MAHSLSSKSQGKQTSEISQCEAVGNDVMQALFAERKAVEPNKPQFSFRGSRLKVFFKSSIVCVCVCMYMCLYYVDVHTCMRVCVHVHICVHINVL